MQAGKWYLVGNPFTSLQGGDTFTINDSFCSDGFGTTDMLYTLGRNGVFVPHYWIVGSDGQGKWYADAIGISEDTTAYPLSTAVYINKNTQGDIVFSGKVSIVEVQVDADEGNAWSIVSLSYPASCGVNDYKWEGFDETDTLYTLKEDGSFIANYWVKDVATGTGKWYEDPIGFTESTVKLAIGQAVYVNKRSAGIGTVTIKQAN